MAADSSVMPINGTHPAPDYEMPDQVSDRAASNSVEYAGADSNTGVGNTESGGGNADIPKDEVAWFFVEKYYTTLSKSPEKLYLFYNKHSQFVSGTETEKVPVCVGQKAINDRIKELDIQDCKVRVTNVDSQASRSNIVIQVIGEISNKSRPHQKFTQCFVLAEQANGYFVLNDIFRYLLDEDEEEYPPAAEEAQQMQDASTTGHQEPANIVADIVPLTSAAPNDTEEQARTGAIVDQHMEEAVSTEPAVIEPPAVIVNGDDTVPTTVNVEADASPVPTTAAVEEPASQATDITEPVAAEEELEPEKPNDPVPSPAPAATPLVAEPVTAPAPAPSKPAAPKTWANLVAGNRANAANAAVTPAVPIAPASSSSSVAPKAAPPIQTQPSVTPTAPAAITPTAPDSDQIDTPHSSGSEWQTAGPDHSRKQSRGQGAHTPAENSRAYIKNVSDAVQIEALEAALTKISDITYVDINRQKNCAFVDFTTPAGYRAAVAANPHEVSGERLYIEERRVRPPGTNPGSFGRGASAQRGNNRPNGQGRGGFQKDNARGGFTGRGRGGMGPRGRGSVTQPV